MANTAILTNKLELVSIDASGCDHAVMAGASCASTTWTGDDTVKAAVVGLHGDLAGRRFAIGGSPVTFGRDNDNDIVIPDPSVSRLHAEIRQEADGYVVVDRGSSNGTWVNGAAIAAHRLRSGDEIAIAGHRFGFEMTADAHDSSALTTVRPGVKRWSCIACGSLRNWRLWMVTTCWRRTLPSSCSFHTTRLPSRFQRPL